MSDGSGHTDCDSVMFVDNPVGTGYSFVDTDSYVHELPEMADQFVKFLEKFFLLFPEYEQDDVSCRSKTRMTSLTITDLYCWRIICRTAHSIYHQGHTGPEPSWSRTQVEYEGNDYWKWLDFAKRAV